MFFFEFSSIAVPIPWNVTRRASLAAFASPAAIAFSKLSADFVAASAASLIAANPLDPIAAAANCALFDCDIKA